MLHSGAMRQFINNHRTGNGSHEREVETLILPNTPGNYTKGTPLTTLEKYQYFLCSLGYIRNEFPSPNEARNKLEVLGYC